MEDGEIRVRATFVVNRPDRIASVDVDPLDWGFQLADLMTFNMASPCHESDEGRWPIGCRCGVNGVDPISAYIWWPTR